MSNRNREAKTPVWRFREGKSILAGVKESFTACHSHPFKHIHSLSLSVRTEGTPRSAVGTPRSAENCIILQPPSTRLRQNKMEPTNPNANTYSKTNAQTIFDTLVGDIFVGHFCRTHSFRKPLWDTLVHSCGAPCMTPTLGGHSCGALL